MRVGSVKELFRQLVASYFGAANVIFSEQPRMAKPNLALVTIRFGNVNRKYMANERYVDGEPVGYYLSRSQVQIDIFTHGKALSDANEAVYAYENTAMEDALAFVDYLNSYHTKNWCHQNDVTIITDGDVLDMTGLVNDSNYEYRARVTLMLYFTQYSVGSAGVLLESSLKGQYIDPEYQVTSSGGGTAALALEKTGYFNDVEITEEDFE